MRCFPARILLVTIFALLMLLCVFLSVHTNDTTSKLSTHPVSSSGPYLGVVPSHEQYYRITTEEKGNKKSGTLSGEQEKILIKNGLLSVNLESYSLLAALNVVSRLSGMPVTAEIQDRQITLQANDVSLDQGIQLLARGLDIFFFHDGATNSLKSVWVYEAGKGNLVAPIPAELWMANREIQRQLVNTDPEERARAAEILVERSGAQAMDWVLQAVRDPVDVVRYRTLQKILDMRLSLPQEILREIMSYDPSPVARFIALDIIFATMGSLNQIEAKQLIEMASNDTDAPVSNHARNMLFAIQGANVNGIR